MRTMRTIGTTLSFALAALGAAGCGDGPLAPESAPGIALQEGQRPGTGLVLDNVTGLRAPILGIELGDIIVDQAIVTDLKVVEDLAGTIIGLQAEVDLQGTVEALGTPVVVEDFNTFLGITSDGPGRCDLVSIDLGPIALEALDPLASVDLQPTAVTVRGSGAVGSLLCALGAALGAPTAAVEGLVNALNNLI
jgi:hypothetical protein